MILIKWILRFLSWFLLMWIAIIPMSWYFIRYYKINFELIQISSLIIQGLFIFGIIFNTNVRQAIWSRLKFMYDLLEQIEKHIEIKKINRLRKKDYVYIKENNA